MASFSRNKTRVLPSAGRTTSFPQRLAVKKRRRRNPDLIKGPVQTSNYISAETLHPPSLIREVTVSRRLSTSPSQSLLSYFRTLVEIGKTPSLASSIMHVRICPSDYFTYLIISKHASRDPTSMLTYASGDSASMSMYAMGQLPSESMHIAGNPAAMPMYNTGGRLESPVRAMS